MTRFFATFFGFLTGAAFGGILGILFAPEKGVHTRERLSYQLAKASESLRENLEDLVEKSKETNSAAAQSGRQVVTELESKAENLLSEVDELYAQIKKAKGE